MICNECGAAIINTARFCARCGSPTYLNRAETQIQRNDTAPINPGSTDQQGHPARPPAPAYTNGPAVGMAPYPACAYHTNIVAAETCVSCSHQFCRACIYNYYGRNYCVNCRARLSPANQHPLYYQQSYGYGYNQYYNYMPVVQPKSPGLALLLSFLMPGAGQIYNGDIGKGVLLFFAFWVLVWIFIGWVFWVVAMVDAYQSAYKINLGNRV